MVRQGSNCHHPIKRRNMEGNYKLYGANTLEKYISI